jgi:phage shock protein C
MNSDTRTLTRSTTDRKLGGVSGGLGAYFGVDPLLFRIGFAVATLASGVGALAYLALLAFVPKDDEAPAGAHPATA